MPRFFILSSGNEQTLTTSRGHPKFWLLDIPTGFKRASLRKVFLVILAYEAIVSADSKNGFFIF